LQLVFDGPYAPLRPGGTLTFTVPNGYSRTVEHFADLRLGIPDFEMGSGYY
jgi:hypothetical protein